MTLGPVGARTPGGSRHENLAARQRQADVHAAAGQFTEAIGVYRQIISDYEHLSQERLTYKWDW